MRSLLFGRRVKLGLGVAIVLAAITLAVLAPVIAPHDPLRQDLLARLAPPAWSPKGSLAHLLGTDNYGRDLLSRLIYGSRISISIGLAAMLLSCGLGSVLGMLAGYRGGLTEQLVMRLADAHLAFPEILLAILTVAAFGGGLVNLILVLGISSWMIYARVTYGLTRSLKGRLFVEAARSLGVPDRDVLRRHILPHLAPVLVVVSTLQVAQMILTETALSFLGLGLPPPAPSWGNILAEGRDRLWVAPWIADSAGIAIILVVWGINMLGNGLREELDPKAIER